VTRRFIGRVARLAASSAAASATDVVLLLVACGVLGIPPIIGATLACLAGGAVNFALNRRFVFRRTEVAWWRQWLRYLGLIVLAGAVLSGGLVHAGVQLGLPLLIAKGVAALVVLAGWNYPLSAFWVFGGTSWRDRLCPS